MMKTNSATRFLMKIKSILLLSLAALLVAVMPSCRDNGKATAEGSATSATSEIKEIKEVQGRGLERIDKLPEAPTGNVVDQAGLLSQADVTQITQLALELDSLKLAQVAVVIVDDLKGMKTLDYATALGNKWGVGHKETNDGITIVVKPKTDDAKGETAIATGKGIEKILTNEVCQLIIDQEMIPEFKKNDYGKAIKEALDKIKEILALHSESKLEILD